MLLAAALLSAGFAQAQDSGLSEYHFIVDAVALGSLGAPVPPFGNVIEVFVRTDKQTTDAYRVTVRFVNYDGSPGSATGVFVRSTDDLDTLTTFRAPNAKQVVSVLIEEKQTTNSKEFLDPAAPPSSATQRHK